MISSELPHNLRDILEIVGGIILSRIDLLSRPIWELVGQISLMAELSWKFFL